LTDPFKLMERIEKAAGDGRGVRLSWEEADMLRCLLELSDAAAQAHFLAADAKDAA